MTTQPPRFRDRVRKSLLLAGGFVNAWASLLALGFAPTATAAVALIVGLVTGAVQQALVIALVTALIVNVVLLVIAIRARSYARDLVHDMELIGDLMRERGTPAPPWLPNADGRLPVTNADFERYFEDALTLARTVGTDAALGVGWIGLTNPVISFNGFTASGQKRLRIWCGPKDGCRIVQLERSSTSVYPTDEPQWRADSTWSDLVTKAYAVEAPFDGSVMLWPRRPSQDRSAWRVEFRRDREGLLDRPVSYVLVDGELTKSS